MEVAAIFILALVVIVLGVLGAAFYALTMWLRARKLAPQGDQIEGEPQRRSRPEHVEVQNEQHARFIGSR